MTLRLILTRHAKSSWDKAQQPDHERPLNPRGRRAAKAIGKWIESRGYGPELILCSTATRTRETCDLLNAALETPAEVQHVKELYHASPEQMMEVLAQSETGNLLVIGHNPGIAALAAELASTPPAHARFDAYPTGATTVFDFAAGDWTQVRHGEGAVRDFVVPADLGVS